MGEAQFGSKEYSKSYFPKHVKKCMNVEATQTQAAEPTVYVSATYRCTRCNQIRAKTDKSRHDKVCQQVRESPSGEKPCDDDDDDDDDDDADGRLETTSAYCLKTTRLITRMGNDISMSN